MNARRSVALFLVAVALFSACGTTPPGSGPGAQTPLRFESAPVFEVATAVSERTGTAFVIGEGVSGRLSLIVPAAAAEPQVIAFFRSALQAAGYDSLPVDGGFRIATRPPPAADDGFQAVPELLVTSDEFLRAAGSGSLDVVLRYLEQGANPNVSGRDGSTALMAAAAGGHLAVVRELVTRGAHPDFSSGRYRSTTSLIRALERGRLDVAGYLVDQGADLQARDTRGTSVLMLAAKQKDAALVKLLLAGGASPHESTVSGERPLLLAAAAGDPVTTSLLLEAGATVRWMEGNSPAAAAARAGSRETLALLAQRAADLDAALVEAVTQSHVAERAVSLLLALGAGPGARNLQGQTALMVAAGFGSQGAVDLLLQSGAEVSARDPEGLTPLLHSFRNSSGARALTGRALVDAGAEVNARDGYGRTALHYAAQRSSSEGVLYLLSKGADHRIQDADGNTALHYAMLSRTPTLVRHLEDAGADFGVRNAAGQTPADLKDRLQSNRGIPSSSGLAHSGGGALDNGKFTEAALKGDQAGVRSYLDAGGNPNCSPAGRPTALHAAAGGGDIGMVRALVEGGAAVDFKGEERHEPPILKAARSGHTDIVAYLLDKGASPLPSRGGESLLAAVAVHGNLELVKRLVAAGADLHTAENALGALHAAAAGGHVAVVRYLLEAGADARERFGSNGKTPLAHAAAGGHAEAMKLLVGAGADPAAALLEVAAERRSDTGAIERLAAAAGRVDPRDANGETPLHAVVRAENFPAVQALLGLGADPRAVNFGGEGVLHIAVESGGQPSIVRVLLAAGAPPDGRDAGGMTPLLAAAAGRGRGDGVAEIMLLLVDKGADPNAADGDGDTPLHHTVRAANSGGVLLLLQAGADRTRRNREGKRPIDLATGKSSDTLKRMLSIGGSAEGGR